MSDATLLCSTTCANAIALEGCSSAHDKTENREANVQECNGVKSVYDSTQRHRERVLAMGSCHGPFSVDTLAQATKWSDRSLLMMEKMSPLAILDNPQICQLSTWVPQPKVGSKTVPGQASGVTCVAHGRAQPRKILSLVRRHDTRPCQAVEIRVTQKRRQTQGDLRRGLEAADKAAEKSGGIVCSPSGCSQEHVTECYFSMHPCYLILEGSAELSERSVVQSVAVSSNTKGFD